MGMNELGPRRCPFAFVSVMLKGEVIIKKEDIIRLLHTWREWMGGKGPRRASDLGVKDL